MKICVLGLWHLGSVTAACMAEHFKVIGCDPDANIAHLREGKAPINEPGLSDLLIKGVCSGQLELTNDIARVNEADVIWVTFDTPIKTNDTADVEHVRNNLTNIIQHLRNEQLILISSQVPVGFTRAYWDSIRAMRPELSVHVAYSPENLQLGKAVETFRRPDRIIAGVQKTLGSDIDKLAPLFRPLCDRIEWMGIESAEMTKHALNAFLAASVVFINEIAGICDKVGADAKEVERGLKSEARIGPKAYLGPGSAFSGGTLARDVMFLSEIGSREKVNTALISAIQTSNNVHKNWTIDTLHDLLGSVRGKTIAILGLTYKPGVNTLRCSASIELCTRLVRLGALVQAYDPTVSAKIPIVGIALTHSIASALAQADALVVATEWPQFKTLSVEMIATHMKGTVVVDPNGFLTLDSRLLHAVVGRGTR